MVEHKILSIKNLSISFFSNDTETEIIHGISYHLYKNEILGIVGESGSGKSVSSLAIMGLLPKHISKITNGSIEFLNEDLTLIEEQELQSVRGKSISMIFQEPMSSLNPSMTCGKQVTEILKQHSSMTKSEIKQQVIELFERCDYQTQNERIVLIHMKFQEDKSNEL